MLQLKLISLDETKRLAAKIAAAAVVGDVITLKGTLGAGKSEFARAFIKALVGQNTVVPSPTFTLMETYEGPSFPISHLDLYRIESTDELMEIGLDEALSRGVTLIEWPERLDDYPLQRLLELEIAVDPNTDVRTVLLKGDENWRERLPKLVE